LIKVIQLWYVNRKWTVTKESSRRCSITGENFGVTDAGIWDCALDSFPLIPLIDGYIYNEYDQVQAFFHVKSFQHNQLPQKTKAFDGDTIELKVKVHNTGSNSKPEFRWFLEDSKATTDYDQNYVNCSENDFYIEETETSDEGWITKFKANFLESDDGLSQIIKFKANILDSGCRLICQILLLDDKQNEVTLPPIISAAV
jgi:hypothetical protein